METEKEETIVGEVMSPIPNPETVEAAKQILTDVLEKAVDAIKETSLSAASATSIEDSNKAFKFGSSLGKFALEETASDYVVECLYDGKQVLIGEGSTFVGSPLAAKGFKTYADAQKFIEDKDSKALLLEEPRILMRETKCKLSELGYGE